MEGTQSLVPGWEENSAFCAGLGGSSKSRARLKGRAAGRSLGHKLLVMCQEGEAVLSRMPLGRLVLGIKGVT